MITAGQDLQMSRVITGQSLFFSRPEKASTEVARVLQVKEANIAICKRGDQDGLCLMSSDCHALLFGYSEVAEVFLIMHVPSFNRAVSATTSDYIILIEGVEVGFR